MRSAHEPPADNATAIVGLQWGDEGKGKLVDIVAEHADAVVRYNGGANAGHSVVIDGTRHAVHLVPSGIFRPGCLAIIANGVVVDPITLLSEIDTLQQAGIDTSGLRLSSRAHVVAPYHTLEDSARETNLKQKQQDQSIGTTGRGIGPAYANKALRAGAIRVADLLRPDHLRHIIEAQLERKRRILGDDTPDIADVVERLVHAGDRLRPSICDSTYLLHDLRQQGASLVFEGANGTLLDIDHGGFPYVTSSNCSVLGIGPGTGISERCLGRVIGIVKAYSTRVGSGPMPTELHDDTGQRIRDRGNEYGTTTGRPRRTGWLDLVAVRYASTINRCTELAVTLLDVLAGFDELKVCTEYTVDGQATDRFIPDSTDLARAEPIYEHFEGFGDDIDTMTSYDDLPIEARQYIDRIESFVGVPVSIVSVGPDRRQTLTRTSPQVAMSP
ncbi:MAG: adenylosuccinate synthase [Phycisphaerales bacterium JB043]